MLNVLAIMKAALARFAASERAQDTFEYVLIIGAVVVAVILAVATPIGTNLIDAIITGVCNAVDALPTMTITCAGISG